MGRDVVLPGAGRDRPGQRVARREDRAQARLHLLADRLRRRLRAVRARVGPQQHDRVPDPAGHPRRRHPGGRAVDALPDRAAGEDRRRDGDVRPRHHRRPGRRPDARRLPGGVRRLAADLLHQRADRGARCDRRGRAAARVPGRHLAPLRRTRLPRDRRRPVLPAPGPLGGRVLGLDELPGAHPAGLRDAVPGAVRRHRARGGPPAARRPGLPLLAVHELADPDRGDLHRPVRGAVLHPALPPAVPGHGRLRLGAPAAPAGGGHGGDDAAGRSHLRPLRSPVARGHRPVGDGDRHVHAAATSRWRPRTPSCSGSWPSARAGSAWR